VITNLEYRIPIVGPVTLAPFVDTGWNFIARSSQLRIAEEQFMNLQSTVFGCPAINSNFQCVGGSTLNFNPVLNAVPGTNYQTRMSTGVELQVILPVVNAPFRIYWAYNPLRVNETVDSPNPITRSMFPTGAAGDYTYAQALSIYQPKYRLSEPLRTFRFTVATTF
jgi:outer membrane protein insertion porin family